MTLGPSGAITITGPLPPVSWTRIAPSGVGTMRAPLGGAPRSGIRATRSRDFEQAGRAHAAADAHRDDDVLRAAALAFDQRVAGEARARDAVRMADRDRTAVDVELVV